MYEPIDPKLIQVAFKLLNAVASQNLATIKEKNNEDVTDSDLG